MTLIKALGLADARLIALVGAGGKTSLMFALAREFVDTGESVLLTTTTRLAADEIVGRWPKIVATNVGDIIASAPRSAGAVFIHAGIDAAASKAIGLDPDRVDRVAASGTFDRIIIEADGAARRPLKVPAAHEPVIPAVAGLSGIGRAFNGEAVFRTDAWLRITGLKMGGIVTAESVIRAAIHPDGFAKGVPPAARQTLLLNQADTPERVAVGRDISHRLAQTSSNPFGRVVIARLKPTPAITDVIALDPDSEVPR